MRRRHTSVASDEAIAIRFAWWVAFLATLTVVAVLGLARSAQALTVPASPGAAIFAVSAPDESAEDEAEASEEEFEDEECGAFEEFEEECEDEGRSAAPPECLLTSTEATISVAPNKDRVRLQVSYTTSAATEASIAYGLHGSKGSLYLGSEKKHLSRQGVQRLTKTVTEAQMRKVTAARGFTVWLRVPAAPGFCKSFFDHQLDVRQATPSGFAWRASA